MVKTYRGYAEGPFGQLHFQDAGAGAPLVLCHQAPMSLRQFDLVFDRLARRGVRAIAFDLPGFGASDAPPRPPTIADYAAAVPPLLDHLEIGAAAVLGHHTGALVATEAALAAPERVTRLILNGPLPMTEAERAAARDYVERVEKAYAPRPDGAHFAELFRNRMQYASADTDWVRASQYIAFQLSGLGPFWYGHGAAFQYDHGAAIARVSQPALILTNTGDALYPHAQTARALRPDFAYAEIEGGGVDIMDEKPADWVDAVCGFLAAHER